MIKKYAVLSTTINKNYLQTILGWDLNEIKISRYRRVFIKK